MATRLIPVVLLALAAVAGCAKVQAEVAPVMPVLEPPPPPPRMVAIYPDDVEPAPEAGTNDMGAHSAPAPPPPKPAAPRVEVTTKPEPPRAEPERPATQPPALTLRPATGTESTTDASIRALLNRASRDLSRVNYASLNADGKAQYDTARRFMQQAEDAIRGGNHVFAGKLADKAATMAAVLVR